MSLCIQNLNFMEMFFRDTNNDMMELMIIAYACRTSAASNIIGVIPYLPYSKQSKMRKRGCIVGKLIASMLGKAGKFILSLIDYSLCLFLHSLNCYLVLVHTFTQLLLKCWFIDICIFLHSYIHSTVS